MRKLILLLALWATSASGEVLHPPGSPVVPECTVASFGSTCGITEQGAMTIITNGSTGGGTECTIAGATPQKCIYDSGGLVIFTGADGAANLTGLSDVTITAPATNEALVYNGSIWVNTNQGSIKTDLTSLDDVTLTSPPTGSFMRKSAGDWIDALLALGDLPAGSLVSTEMDDWTEFKSQINVDATYPCNTTTFLRGDGKCFPANSVVEVPDPAEAGSFTDGIQEAITRCPSTGCIVQLQCDTTYVLDKVFTASGQDALSLNKTDLWLRGCGADSTILSYNKKSENFGHQIIDVLSDRVRLSDFKLLVDDTCGDTGGDVCNETLAAAINIGSGIDDTRMERLHLDITSGTAIATRIEYRGIWFSGSTPFPQRGMVLDSHIVALDRGLEIQFGDDIDVIGNTFAFNRPGGYGSDQGMLIIKYEGIGDRVIGNDFDMTTGTPPDATVLAGILMVNRFGDVNTPGEYMQVQSNTFRNLPNTTNTKAILISNYKHANIGNNLIKAGKRCSEDNNKACSTGGDCSGTCDVSDAIGIEFNDGSGGTSNGNNWNVIADNIFEGFADTATACPIFIPAPSTAGDNWENSITGNLFRSDDFDAPTTDDGFCGDEATLRQNFIHGNVVTDQAKQCIAGRGPGSECAIAMDLSDVDGQPKIVLDGDIDVTAAEFTGGKIVNTLSIPGFIAHDSAYTDLNSALFGVSIGCTGADFSEDCDAEIRQMIGGLNTQAVLFDADGDIDFKRAVTSTADVRTATCLQAGSLTAGSATCVCASSDRLYHDTDCDATKDAGETFIDSRDVFYDWKTPLDATTAVGIDTGMEWVNKTGPQAWTLTRIECESYDTNSITIKLCKGDDVGDDTCTTDLHVAALVCDSGGGTACASGCDTTLSNTSMAARQEYTIVVTAAGASVFDVGLILEGTID